MPLDNTPGAASGQEGDQNVSQDANLTQNTGVSADAGASAAATGDSGAAGGVAGAVSTDAGAAQQAQAWALREELKNLGVDTTQFQDDRAAWQFLQGRLREQATEFERQRQSLAYLQQQLLAAQQAQQQATQPKPEEKKSWWTPPEYNPLWEQPVGKDKDGNPLYATDLDPTARIKLEQYRQWQRETFNNLLRDPIKTIEPGLKEFVAPLIQEAIQQHLGRYQEQQFVNSFISNPQVADWIYQKDQAGNRLTDHFGRPMLTPGGQLFVKNLAWAEQMGVRDVQAQQQLASALVELEILRARNGQQGGAANGGQTVDKNAQLKANALQRGNGATRLPSSGSGPAVPATTASGGNRGVDPRLKLKDELTRAIVEAGGVR